MTEPTPRPWRADHERILGDGNDPVCVIVDPTSTGSEPIDWPIVGRIPTEADIKADANAALIVKAVNNHDALLEWLTKAAQMAEQQYDTSKDMPLRSAWDWLRTNAQEAIEAAS